MRCATSILALLLTCSRCTARTLLRLRIAGHCESMGIARRRRHASTG